MTETHFTISRGKRRLVLAPGVPAELGEEWLASWTDAFGPERRPLPDFPAKVDLALVDCELGTVVMKREEARGLRGLGLRPTRPGAAFDLGRAMVAADVSTPEPYAVVIERLGFAKRRACLVLRFIDGESPWKGTARDLEAAPRIAAALGTSIAQLHRAGFRHRDLKAPNLLIEGAETDTPRAWILDLDGAEVCRPDPNHMTTMRDLSRLAASFLSAPAVAAGVTLDHWRELVRVYLDVRYARTPDSVEVDEMVHATRIQAEIKIAVNRKRRKPLA